MIRHGHLAFCLFSLLLLNSVNYSNAQTINAEYERFQAIDAKYIQSGLAMSPDRQYLAIATTQSYPLYIVDISSRKPVKKFDVGNWYAGSKVSWSAGGKYLLLQQLFYIDFARNKDREVDFEIVDASGGQSVKRFDNYHDVKISPDEKFALTLQGNTVEVVDLATGKVLHSINNEYATNSLCISPDGRFFGISERPRESFLNKDPYFKKNKKGKKFTLKYKQVVSIYSMDDFTYQTSVNEFYDNIYRLEWTGDGRNILCLNIPHAKATTATSGRQNFISVIDAVKLEATRVVFPSNSNYEPDFRLSHDGSMIAVVSWGKFAEIRVHDFTNGQVNQRLEMGYRLFEGIDKLDMPSDGRVFVEFTPDDKSVFATFGNKVLQWNLPVE